MNSSHALVRALGVLVLLGTAGPALAASLGAAHEINPIAATRSIAASGTSFCPGCGPMGEDESFSNEDSAMSDLLGVFDEQVLSVGSDAIQTSNVASDDLVVELAVGLGFTGFNEASSYFSATFDVATAGTYAVEGAFSHGTPQEHYVRLDSSSGLVFEILFGLGDFREQFALVPGETYTLEAGVSGFDASGSPSTIGLGFQLVPEPGTGLMAGLGFSGLAWLRRRRRSIRVCQQE